MIILVVKLPTHSKVFALQEYLLPKEILPVPQEPLKKLSLVCPDFKIFNPLNERLINRDSFPNLEFYHFGQIDEERWPKVISGFNVLYSPKLKEVRMTFRKMTSIIAQGIVRWVRQHDMMTYRPN